MFEFGGSGHPRWELYRVLGEPVRLRLLALAAEEELSIGELAELLEENQPNISRHAAALRQAGLLQDRREGTRTLVRAAPAMAQDAVVADALASGRELCEQEGSLARVQMVLQARDAPSREFFSRPGKGAAALLPMETGAHLFALGALLPQRSIAVDAGTGDGRLLDVLSPAYQQVIAIDRSEIQLARARDRVAERGFANVTLLGGEIDSPRVRRALTRSGGGREAKWGADAVFASRVLHHSPQPARAVAQLASLCASGGHLVLIDYVRHDDEKMRDQADAWLGFDPAELRRFARGAGLEEPRITNIPPNLRGDGPDRHLQWQVLIATKPAMHENRGSRTSNEKGRSDG